MLDRNAISIKVRQILAKQLGFDFEEVIEATHPHDDLNADSLDAIEIVMEVEDEFQITITDDEASRLSDVGSIIDHVHDKLVRAGRAQ